MKISKQDFEAWRSSPVTEAFFDAINDVAERARLTWMEASWNNERIWTDHKAGEMRAACRARAECAEDILNLNFEEENDSMA